MTAENGKPVRTKANKRKELNDEFKKAHPFTFVNIALSDGEKSEIVAAPMPLGDIPVWMGEMACGLAYKVGLSWSHDDGCFVLSVTSQFWGRDDYNRCVTSRHHDLGVVFAIAAWKHEHYCYDGIPAPSVTKRDGVVFD